MMPPLVLIHGLGTGPGAWGPQVEAFSASREVRTPRLRLDAGFSIAAEAARLLDELEADGPFDLCGHSLGALVALRTGLDRPEAVRRLVLCAGFAALPRAHALLQIVIGSATALVPAHVLREQLAQDETADFDPRAIRHIFREGRRFDVRAELGRLTMPVLVLVGDRDRANLGLSRELAGLIRAAELEIVPGAGHIANRDAPEAFNAALSRFWG